MGNESRRESVVCPRCPYSCVAVPRHAVLVWDTCRTAQMHDSLSYTLRVQPNICPASGPFSRHFQPVFRPWRRRGDQKHVPGVQAVVIFVNSTAKSTGNDVKVDTLGGVHRQGRRTNHFDRGGGDGDPRRVARCEARRDSSIMCHAPFGSAALEKERRKKG